LGNACSTSAIFVSAPRVYVKVTYKAKRRIGMALSPKPTAVGRANLFPGAEVLVLVAELGEIPEPPAFVTVTEADNVGRDLEEAEVIGMDV
jgi:hypothetical protein